MKLYRPATVTVGVLFVLLGGLTRLAAPDQVYGEDNRAIVHGTIGETLTYGGSQVTVTRMKFVKSLRARESDEDVVESNGIFVAIEYDTVRGTPDPPSNDATLVADGGSVYAPVAQVIADGFDFAEPGFGKTGALVFEVNPADLSGLTLKVRTIRFFTVLAEDLAVDLGVPDETIAQQHIDKADAEYVLPKSVTRVAE
ncbi:hypothetical protein GCM10009789_16940 [Kribbella sancticallisti]|uniref:DUF4352 domain-containing protein n=1 Tax=Kribbella sancticallisti TaxID=460087 RepID=A0ABP4NRC2_9ACTN